MKTTKIIFAGLAALFMVFMTACSDDPQSSEDKANPKNFVKKGKIVQGEIDYNVLSRYSAALKDATYTRSNTKYYFQDDLTKGRWEKEDAAVGQYPSTPKYIVIKEGACWEAFEPNYNTGHAQYISAMFALNLATGKEYNVILKKDLTVDEASKTITIGSKNFELLYADSEYLVVGFKSTYQGGRTHNGGESLEISSYSLSEPFVMKDTPLAFDSLRDAYDWLIDTFRERFGESADLNKYITSAIYDNPMVYLSDLIAERDYYVSLEDGE